MKPGFLLQDAYRNAQFSALLSFVDQTGAPIPLTDYDSVEARYFEKADQDTANAVVIDCTVVNNAVSWNLTPAQTKAFYGKLVYFELWFLKEGDPDDVKVNGRLVVSNVPDAAATGAATVTVNNITETIVVSEFIGGGGDGSGDVVGPASAVADNFAAFSGTTGKLIKDSGKNATDFVDKDDSRLTDSREWVANTVPQSEAETGTASTRRAWTAQRVRQAINSRLSRQTEDKSIYHIHVRANGESPLANGTALLSAIASAVAPSLGAGFEMARVQITVEPGLYYLPSEQNIDIDIENIDLVSASGEQDVIILNGNIILDGGGNNRLVGFSVLQGDIITTGEDVLIKNCRCINLVTTSDLNGTYVDIEATGKIEGVSGMSGLFVNCKASLPSFNNTNGSALSGTFFNCKAEDSDSFGFESGFSGVAFFCETISGFASVEGQLTGEVHYCTMKTGAFPTPTSPGRIIACSDSTGFVNYPSISAASVPWSGVTDKPTTFTPSSHTHGNLSNDGKIGTTANIPLITGTDGVVQAGSFGTNANEFAEGNDSRFHEHANKASLDKIGESGGEPTWDGGVWPGGGATDQKVKYGLKITDTANIARAGRLFKVSFFNNADDRELTIVENADWQEGEWFVIVPFGAGMFTLVSGGDDVVLVDEVKSTGTGKDMYVECYEVDGTVRKFRTINAVAI